MSNNDWYLYYAPRRVAGLTAERMIADRVAAERDLDFVIDQIGLTPGDAILEIGCGWGRHALALAARGFAHVLSIDIAPAPLAVARALAAEAGIAARFEQRDLVAAPRGPFAAILSLYDRSCCGFPREADDLRTLRSLADRLLPGGWLVFGIDDWPFALPSATRGWEQTAAGLELTEVIPDRVAMTCTDRVTLIDRSGRRESWSLTRRHYYLPELQRLLDAAGFELASAWHRLDRNRPYGDGGDGLWIVARRRDRGVP